MAKSITSNIFTGKDSLQHLTQFFSSNSFSKIFILVDDNTLKHCYPKIKSRLPKHEVIKIKSGEKNKTLTTCELIWNQLTKANADRKALLVNLGGGVVSDIGGFAAGCYKRGIKYINIPTSLLAMVDASVGSKTGIDFNGFKNQIGLFQDAEAVFVDTAFLKTLADRHVRAGLAEVVKHYLIADKKAFKEMFKQFTPKLDNNIFLKDYDFPLPVIDWDKLVQKNIAIKSKIVASDKLENGNRKALNFAHTLGHAVETYLLSKGKDVLHGEAIAIGILCEASISFRTGFMPQGEFPYILILLGSIFPNLPNFRKQSIVSLLKLMEQDKKNAGGKKQFTLLKGIGNYSVNNFVEEQVIIDSLEYYSEMTLQHK